MEAKHTPWSFEAVEENYAGYKQTHFIIVDANGGAVVGSNGLLQLHYARLIAAAPELLEAAKDVNASAVKIYDRMIDEFVISGVALRKLVAAIAKAQPQEGEGA